MQFASFFVLSRPEISLQGVNLFQDGTNKQEGPAELLCRPFLVYLVVAAINVAVSAG